MSAYARGYHIGQLIKAASAPLPGPAPVADPGTPAQTAETLASAVAHHYAKVPGGFQGAVAAARKVPATPGFQPLDYGKLGTPAPVTRGDFPWPTTVNGATLTNWYEGGARATNPHVYLQSKPGVTPEVRQQVKEHELTHAWQDYSSPTQKDNRVPSWDIREPTGNPVMIQEPSEMDPRLARLKRLVADHGLLVDTPEKARAALEANSDPNAPLVPGAPVEPRDYEQLQLRQLWEAGDPGVKKLLIQRMLQLVRGQGNQSVAYG